MLKLARNITRDTMRRRRLTITGVLIVAGAISQAADIPRTSRGRPDLSGTYDVSTLTPLQRPEKLGDKLMLTDEEAAAIARNEAERLAGRNAASNPNREPPPSGGDGSTGGKGNVGGYDAFWKERGTGAIKVDDKWRTSISTYPADGRRPPLIPEAEKRAAARAEMSRPTVFGSALFTLNSSHSVSRGNAISSCRRPTRESVRWSLVTPLPRLASSRRSGRFAP